MPLQQISVSPLDWTKESANIQRRQDHWKIPEPVFTTSGSNPLERCPSQSSTLSNNNDICRICHCESEEDAPLIAPCYCAGSLRYVHQACLQQWIKSSDIRSCELCKFQFVMQSKLKPMNQWESLDMSGVERRKLLCSVTFHAVALTCVVWSLYVLIDRTADEIQRGVIEWPFWTKLIVVAIGFTGGIVFMYIQCKAYLHLCRRWRAFNRVIYVQNVPEKVALPPAPVPLPPPKLVHQDSSFVSESCCGVVTAGDLNHRRLLPIMVHRPSGAAEPAYGAGERKDDVRITMATCSGGRSTEAARGCEEAEETSRLLDDGGGGVQIVPAGAGTSTRWREAAEGPSVQIVQLGDGTNVARVRSATDHVALMVEAGGAERSRTAPDALQGSRGAERRDV